MDVSRSSGLALIPRSDPPGYLLQGLPSELEHSFGDRSKEEVRTLLWVTALAEAFDRFLHEEEGATFELMQPSDLPPGAKAPEQRLIDTVAYGFLDPDTEADAFGVILYAGPEWWTPRISRPSPGRRLPPIVIDGMHFPVVIRHYSFEPHMPTIHPVGGRSTCWAETSTQQVGILTAGHVVDGLTTLPNVDLVEAAGGIVTGTLLARGPGGIDAAVVEPPQGVPGGRTPLLIDNWIAPWSDVQLHLGRRAVSTKVSAVTDTRGVLHAQLPSRVFLAAAGKPGDSGAACSRQSDGAFVGLYMGEMVTQANATEGVCQHLGQVRHTMNVSLSE